ncbi:hypothetical protein [Novosphingobium cyanobacteriorum]|uniref:Uncharacterized protein n=1 Tax=Novosphingobium cyanobacteriorum TaxID=3024215 RepID=A0ABT6CKR9_9SPHN|nr:hypothetical protein [Novosphingobium cyanobacteriorum]MDF8334496.1 hypothetical protein [Novosphingobium cyanobacteriorum]
MRVNRRSVLKAGALAGVSAATPALAAMGGEALVIHDSRIAESRAFAMGQGIDLARGWSQLRAHPGAARVEGLTRWSDYVALRGLLAARGLRVLREEKVPAPLSGRAHLFRWSMATR